MLISKRAPLGPPHAQVDASIRRQHNVRYSFFWSVKELPSATDILCLSISCSAALPPTRCTAAVGSVGDAVTAIVSYLGLRGATSDVFLTGARARGAGVEVGMALRNTRAGGN